MLDSAKTNPNNLKKARLAERQITLKKREINSNNSAIFLVLVINGSK